MRWIGKTEKRKRNATSGEEEHQFKDMENAGIFSGEKRGEWSKRTGTTFASGRFDCYQATRGIKWAEAFQKCIAKGKEEK